MVCENHVLGAWYCFSGPVSPIFCHFRSSCSNNLPWNLGTEFLPLVSLTSPLESSILVFLSIHKSSDVLDLHDFFVNYFENPLKLLWFGKTRITDSNIENITNILKSYAIVLILLLFAAKTN